MQIPMICETPGCANEGAEINRVTGISPERLDQFYEGEFGTDPADFCPLCGELGIALDPEPEEVGTPSAGESRRETYSLILGPNGRW